MNDILLALFTGVMLGWFIAGAPGLQTFFNWMGL